MANSLYSELGGARNGAPNMMAEFQRFKANFQGDPKAEVERLLQSGRMTQQQLNKLQSRAQQFMRMMQR